jgi:hypothetical protein
MAITPEIILGVGGTVLLGVVGFFLKKTHDKIDSTAAVVNGLESKFNDRLDRFERQITSDLKVNKQEVIEVFQDICHERQESCSVLRDTKLANVEERTKLACTKISKVMDDRARAWDKQEVINESIKRVLYRTKDGGVSWKLKERSKNEN